MSTLDRLVTGFRHAETVHGDTVRSVALRELGDASRWPELVAFNDLLPPYITDDAGLAGPRTLLSGSLIRIPAPATERTAAEDPELVFERDVALDRGELAVVDGDLGTVSGLPNLRQALVHRLGTDRGELSFHPGYGSPLRRIIGTANGPTAGLLASTYARQTVAQDPRITRVLSSTAEVLGDRVAVDVVAQPIVGRQIDVSASI